MNDLQDPVNRIIARYGLAPHPEGGFYREVFRSRSLVISSVTERPRQAVTHIYFLLPRGQVSRFHRVVHDEIWNFYEGAPVRLITFDGQSVQETRIGPEPEGYAAVVPGGVFQAAESTGAYSLTGCTVAPGFDFSDFAFLSGNRPMAEILHRDHSSYSAFL
ncbi:MAG: cupin domain-containing protein [Pseudomonadota bacterium]